MKRGTLIAVSILAWAWLAWWLVSGFGWWTGLPLLAALIAFCFWTTLSTKKAKG